MWHFAKCWLRDAVGTDMIFFIKNMTAKRTNKIKTYFIRRNYYSRLSERTILTCTLSCGWNLIYYAVFMHVERAGNKSWTFFVKKRAWCPPAASDKLRASNSRQRIFLHAFMIDVTQYRAEGRKVVFFFLVN